MEQPDYALGYHQAWEVYLHGLRHSALEGALPLTPMEELRLLEKWFTKNIKIANNVTLCHYCQNYIAQALLEGKDPFACPQNARDLLNAAQEKLLRRYRK